MRKTDIKMLELLVCPQTKKPLEYNAEKQILISKSAKRTYRIQDGVPILLVSESEIME